MAESIVWIERFVSNIPLPILEVWGRFSFLFGSIIAIFAFTGFTFRNGKTLRISREVWNWNLTSFYWFLITFVSIFITGYLGSSIVLIPGAQTFESLKDLSVFLCLNFFGFPALLAVPFAYGLSDLMEGVPPDFLWDWLPGYFINPSLFWISYQMIGKSPNFRKLKVWVYYFLFVILFLLLEPFLWGYLCSEQFGAEISYHTISSALLFTTGITWLLAPFVMFITFPIVRKFGFFWAEVPGQVKEVTITEPQMVWKSGQKEIVSVESDSELKTGISLQLFIVTPFVGLVLFLVGITAYVTLKNAEQSAFQMVGVLHRQWSKNIVLSLDQYFSSVPEPNLEISGLAKVLDVSKVNEQGKVFLLDESLSPLAFLSSDLGKSRFLETVRVELKKLGHEINTTEKRFSFAVVTKKPLSRENWNAMVTQYSHPKLKEKTYLITLFPNSFYLSGVITGNSKSAMVFAWAILLSLILAAVVAEFVTRPVLSFAKASKSLAKGDWNYHVDESMIAELKDLSDAFRFMSKELKLSFDRVEESQRMVMETNSNLEEKIGERTEALIQSNRSLLEMIEAKEKILIDLHNTQAQLLMSEKLAALGQFAAGITHELNTPLGAITSSVRAMSEIIKNDITNLPEFLESLDTSERENFQYLLHLSLSFGSRNSGILNRAEKKERLGILNSHQIQNPEEVLEDLTSLGILHFDEPLLKVLKKPRSGMILQNVHILGSLYRLVYVIQTATEKASHVVNALKHYLHTDRLETETELQKVHIPTEMDSILTLYQAKIKNDVEVIKLYNTTDYCLAERDKLNQVWINIINNALQAMDYRGKIAISVTSNANFVITSIRDSGKGIAPEIRDKIFLPFFTTKKHGEGIGLGLDICKQIVEKMKGKIEFASDDYGTEFIVYLPKGIEGDKV
ncbi:ATP-binding protein [Leptospira sp. 2 VSF19]|uniref:histidine kinase n=1 Tax=Leptospira soteropolitanensis TaxID=2950025 RepID=A0AAW5VHC9_9LEPT|nr:ATP-binding protein [Leptospira soteropolitanensis]MCW7492971.1 ATP-binding protein [Leptospira soteropolitanensis]MCW7500206.1 ATP-binding protein [Leptospira soteropolitanensis]MCW7522457.1 ATP-binding protein [Leptospira soteropolitanensis]MCW7526313.1 ATP-binding protein [Leptospira soteropolitanensis]MCW7529575.1 ATP-binding protein [Leptospira soteropolitanensis]